LSIGRHAYVAENTWAVRFTRSGGTSRLLGWHLCSCCCLEAHYNTGTTGTSGGFRLPLQSTTTAFRCCGGCAGQRSPAYSYVEVLKMAKTKKRAASKKRGGVFLYFAGPKDAPDQMPKPDARVHKLLRSRKDGVTLKEIVRRLRMPASTADWARIRLMKDGAMIRKRSTV
jgi:hypothetical protein